MRSNRLFRLPMGLVILLLFVSSTYAEQFPYPKVDYSADLVMDMGKGPDGRTMVVKGKIFASKGNERREMLSAGQERVIITRRDKGVNWMLIPEQKNYMETLKDKGEKDPERIMRESDVKLTKLGSEKINGVMAIKYEIESTDPGSGQFKGFLWVTKENIPVRMEGGQKGMGSGQHFRIDYTRIRIGKQDASLFEVPTDYDRLAIPQMPGFPGMGAMPGGKMPQGHSPGEMSEEQAKKEAEKIKKQLEDMMKQFRQVPEDGD
jgi:hypothetical protein